MSASSVYGTSRLPFNPSLRMNRRQVMTNSSVSIACIVFMQSDAVNASIGVMSTMRRATSQ